MSQHPVRRRESTQPNLAQLVHPVEGEEVRVYNPSVGWLQEKRRERNRRKGDARGDTTGRESSIFARRADEFRADVQVRVPGCTFDARNAVISLSLVSRLYDISTVAEIRSFF